MHINTVHSRHVKGGSVRVIFDAEYHRHIGFVLKHHWSCRIKIKETSIPWAVRLSWLENPYSHPEF